MVADCAYSDSGDWYFRLRDAEPAYVVALKRRNSTWVPADQPHTLIDAAARDQTAMVKRSRPLQDSFTAVARIPKPLVAAITGYALVVAASSPCAPITGSPRTTPGSASPRSCSG